uniref:UAS domain-containing protein n=1 Tax=Ditylenchus dipsaci TaxID=166011 RepID=A0A915CQ73_9BILA
MSSNLSDLSGSFEDLAETSHSDENVAKMSSLNLHDYEVESDSTEGEQEPDTSEGEAPDHQDLLSDEDEEISSSNQPLFPKLIYDIKGAVMNFGRVFNARYGTNHAPFFAGNLNEAIEEAFVAPGHPESDRKPLAIYLHSDDKDASASNVFPQKILCSETVSSLLSKQYVTWPFDMTSKYHQAVFYELISNTVCAEIKDEIQKIPVTKYPLLRKHNYRIDKDEKDVIKETDYIKKALGSDVKYFLDYQRPGKKSRNSGNTKFSGPPEVPSGGKKKSQQSKVTTIKLPKTTDVASFTDLSKFTVDVSSHPLTFRNVYEFSVNADSCFAFEFSLLREKQVAKNLKIVTANLRDNEIGLLLEHCISGCSSKVVDFVNPLNDFAPISRMINLFQCANELSCASLFILLKLTEKAQLEVQQFIAQNTAGSSEDSKDLCILVHNRKEDRVLKMSFSQQYKKHVTVKFLKITVEDVSIV